MGDLNMDGKQKQLFDLVKRMRVEQKSFFSAHPGTYAKEKHLQDSKGLEKQVDQLLVDIECGQEEIF